SREPSRDFLHAIYLSRRRWSGQARNLTRPEPKASSRDVRNIIPQMQARHAARSFVGILRVWLAVSADAPMALRVAAASATAFARCCHRFKGATMKATVIPALAAVVILASAVGFAQTAPPPGPRADTAFVSVQPQGQWLASRFVGQAVSNQAGQNVGDINDLLFDKTGRISTAVIGVGGFLGIGEKSVAIPF